MSDTTILNVIPRILISAFPTTWTEDNCKGMSSGQPNPMMPDIFAAVHITSISGTKAFDKHIEQVYNWAITVTKRIGAVPKDRIPTSIYIGKLKEIQPVIDRIIIRIAERWNVTKLLNDELEIDAEASELIQAQGFISPSSFISRTPVPTFNDEEWFHGRHGDPIRDLEDGHIGISMTAQFGRLTLQTVYKPEICT